MADVKIVAQNFHPDRLKLPTHLFEPRRDMHYRWVNKEFYNSRVLDGWVKVQGKEGVIETRDAILMCIPKSKWALRREQKQALIDMVAKMPPSLTKATNNEGVQDVEFAGDMTPQLFVKKKKAKK